MHRARIALALVAGTVLALGLSGCEKPNPGASVFSGTTTKWQQANCWGFDGAAIDVDACAKDVIETAQSGVKLPVVPVIPGQTIGISVDPVVADAGWQPLINNQPITPTPITSTYYRFTFPEFQDVPEDGILMQILAGEEGSARGIWMFRLVPS